MDRIVYDRMAAHDSTHWWYRARRDILADYLITKRTAVWKTTALSVLITLITFQKGIRIATIILTTTMKSIKALNMLFKKCFMYCFMNVDLPYNSI